MEKLFVEGLTSYFWIVSVALPIALGLGTNYLTRRLDVWFGRFSSKRRERLRLHESRLENAALDIALAPVAIPFEIAREQRLYLLGLACLAFGAWGFAGTWAGSSLWILAIVLVTKLVALGSFVIGLWLVNRGSDQSVKLQRVHAMLREGRVNAPEDVDH